MSTVSTFTYVAPSDTQMWITIHTVTGYSVFSLCFLANAVGLVIMCKGQGTLSASQIIVRNLTVCDMIFGFVQVTILAFKDIVVIDYGLYTDDIIMVITGIGIIPSSASSYILCLIGIDRFVAIFWPLRYPSIVSKRRVWLTIFFSWVVAAFMSSPFLLSPVYDVTWDMFNRYIAIMGIAGYALMTFFQIVIYGKIFHLIFQTRRKIQSLERSVLGTSHVTSFKATKRLIMFLACYTLLWGPFMVHNALTNIFFVISDGEWHVLTLLVYFGQSNSFVNLLLYACSDTSFKKKTRKLFCKDDK